MASKSKYSERLILAYEDTVAASGKIYRRYEDGSVEVIDPQDGTGDETST